MKAPSLLELEGGVAIALVAGAALVVYLVLRNARAAARATVNAAGDLVAGTVEGIGEQVGIPTTDPDKCAAAIAAGRSWDASFYCPAGQFLRYVFSSSGSAPVPMPSPYSINPRDRT